MTVDLLVVTMNQTDDSLIDTMNIQTNAIIGNQTNKNEVRRIKKNGNTISYYSFDERGVGLNRNNILMRTNADIAIFADDDMIMKDHYEEMIIAAFERHPDAAVIIFNLDDDNKRQVVNTKDIRLHYWNYGRYGAARIAINVEKIKKKSIYFNLLFGGGAQYGSGEDTLFLKECLDKGLTMYAVPETVARLTNFRESTWNRGVNKKWLNDAGASKAACYGKFAYIHCVIFMIRHKKYFLDGTGIGFVEAINYMYCGVKKYLD